MIGGLSSSLSLAQRTATKARATMDTMARQIATGQKVSSVKDDGAAWSRAAGLKSQHSEIAGRAFILAQLKRDTTLVDVSNVQAVDQYRRAAEIIVQAMALPANSSARQKLQEEWNQLVIESDTISVDSPDALTGGAMQLDGKWGILAGPSDTKLNGRTVYTTELGGITHWLSSGWIDGTGTALMTANILSGSNAELTQRLAGARELENAARAVNQQTANDQKWIQHIEDQDAKDTDRLNRAIGSLTDADLGRASTALRQSETRQQLALDTVSRAISAYGNYAGGLLSNVQRTQRAIA